MTIEQELKQLRAEMRMMENIAIVRIGLYGRFNEEGK